LGSKRNITLYALSTCVWCKRTKRLLDNLGVNYATIYVDLLSREDEEEVDRLLAGLNPEGTFPVLVIDDGKEVICGYEPDKIRETVL
jgi:glutaredoxin-like protein NrdH